MDIKNIITTAPTGNQSLAATEVFQRCLDQGDQCVRDYLSKRTIVVWFSCGAASAVAAIKTIERYSGEYNIRIVNNPVAEEHPDNLRFLKDVEKHLGIEIEFAHNPKYPNASIKDVFEARRYVSGPAGAPCTVELKKKARQNWERNNDFDYMVLGFTFDEVARHERFISSELLPVLPVLIDARLTKTDCMHILDKLGIELPAIYKLGFPNANCIGCVKAASPTYWNLVRQHFPSVFEDRAEQSERLGCRLTRQGGKRVFLSELLPETKGRMLKSDFECGILCSTEKRK